MQRKHARRAQQLVADRVRRPLCLALVTRPGDLLVLGEGGEEGTAKGGLGDGGSVPHAFVEAAQLQRMHSWLSPYQRGIMAADARASRQQGRMTKCAARSSPSPGNGCR